MERASLKLRTLSNSSEVVCAFERMLSLVSTTRSLQRRMGSLTTAVRADGRILDERHGILAYTTAGNMLQFIDREVAH